MRTENVRQPYPCPNTVKTPSWLLVGLFLSAIIAANLSVARWGVAALPYTAFIMIPFDLVIRDALHDRWKSKHLYRRMAILLLAGGLLSGLVNVSAFRVALGSVTAFIIAGSIDCLVYSMRGRKLTRMTLSNLAGAVTDSVVFPLVALGVLDSQLSLRQAAVKFVGSLVWIALLYPLLAPKSNED